MFYRRQGMPEVDDIVLCQVTKIYPNSVFVELLEYGSTGIVHISEVSPGRIRNLRDFVSIDRQIVCKVLRVDRQTGNIDLSLRRVNTTQRQEKLEEIKQELKAESLIKNLATKLKRSPEQLYAEISKPIFKDYSHIYLCFHAVAEGKADFSKMGLPKNLADELNAITIEKFRPKKIFIKGEIKLQTYHSEGLDKVKSVLGNITKVSPTIGLTYLGAGRYQFIIEDVDYKPAEATLAKVQGLVDGFQDKLSEASLVREKSE
jgi:translation initiation factor 2 subunit 1